jgi:hypothetical protein
LNLQEFQEKVQAEKIANAEKIRKVNLEKTQAFIATLNKEGK